MSSFVEIKKVYDTVENRNINYLSKIYQNKLYLHETIKILIDNHISHTDITDKKVLLKPNWVRHNLKQTDSICLCTDENFILAALEVVLEKAPKSVIIGDAPVQGCDWSKVLSHRFYQSVEELSNNYFIPITIKDFRRVVSSNHKLSKDRHDIDEYLIFDIGEKSYLELITNNEKLFRITCYDYNRLAESHHKGTHKYCVTKDLFESDVIITIPKIKTHQKTGITNAMKILVGINGDKDYLPHHRKGSKESGGDCYPETHIFRSIAENLFDLANKKFGTKYYFCLSRVGSILWKLSNPNPEQNAPAGWYGNDTIWRTVYDLNMVALYGKKDGTLAEIPQRKLYSLCDGIIGGQGNGPLQPTPLALGIIAFSDDAELMDIVAGYLLNFEIEKIPILNSASHNIKNRDCKIIMNNEQIGFEELKEYAVDVKMPPGWVKYNQQ
jgi:uncharacterized protein (DUF362 family)